MTVYLVNFRAGGFLGTYRDLSWWPSWKDSAWHSLTVSLFFITGCLLDSVLFVCGTVEVVMSEGKGSTP